MATDKAQARPIMLQAVDREAVGAFFHINCQQFRVTAILRHKSDKVILILTPKRFYNKDGKWRRFRHRLKDAQDPAEYALKADHLQPL